MNERGKLEFKENADIENNEELKELREHWKSFAGTEESEREKYLRELEIQFSMNSFVAGEGTDAAKGRMASYAADRKSNQPARKNNRINRKN
ncbi:MAG: hypothetical protein IKT04_04440 [Clostridia bacterium]|nr:hypothetical protein [Clostridia bacterium]MBR5977267.1 hypothetical protein [Clostridia bacterium]MBR6479732.1 hypothetical protein [Clostridia bacterium]MBR6512149.1 hypothetical protein [Clostridia bacterium]